MIDSTWRKASHTDDVSSAQDIPPHGTQLKKKLVMVGACLGESSSWLRIEPLASLAVSTDERRCGRGGWWRARWVEFTAARTRTHHTTLAVVARTFTDSANVTSSMWHTLNLHVRPRNINAYYHCSYRYHHSPTRLFLLSAFTKFRHRKNNLLKLDKCAVVFSSYSNPIPTHIWPFDLRVSASWLSRACHGLNFYGYFLVSTA